MLWATRSISKLLFFSVTGGVAALYAGFAAFMYFPQFVDILRSTDPTGLFGWLSLAPSLLANIGTIFLFVAFVWGYFAGRDFTQRYALFMAIAFLKLLEATALSICFIGPPEALCGVFSLMIAQMSSPVILVLLLVFILNSADVILKRAASALFVFLLLGTALAYTALSPRHADGCMTYSEITQRAACLHKFARASADPQLCRKIEFRSTRFACFRDLAEAKHDPALCEQIQDPPGITLQPYESPSTLDRDTCYWVMAFNVQKKSMCMRIQNVYKKVGQISRNDCLSKAAENGWGE